MFSVGTGSQMCSNSVRLLGDLLRRRTKSYAEFFGFFRCQTARPRYYFHFKSLRTFRDGFTNRTKTDYAQRPVL